jgi:homoserine O-acetyltransferase
MVRAQFLLLNHLGVRRLHASVGSSMGGMQSLAASALFPDRVGRCISISACARSHPYSIALRFAQRAVLMNDPHWHQGFYYPQFGPLDETEMQMANLSRPDRLPPHRGMKLARVIATVGYRSGPEWEKRFGRRRVNSALPEEQQQLKQWQRLTDNPQFCPDFLIESYLDHQVL